MNLKLKDMLVRDYLFYTAFIMFVITFIVTLIEIFIEQNASKTLAYSYGMLALSIICFLFSIARFIKIRNFLYMNKENRTNAVISAKQRRNKSYSVSLTYTINSEEYTSKLLIPNLRFARNLEMNQEVEIIYDQTTKKVFIVEGLEE